MIYVVEMDFRNPAREHDWHVWYLEHTTHLVRTIPGFTGTQRFRCLTQSKSPWLAMHEVAGLEVFESKEYKAGVQRPPANGPRSIRTGSATYSTESRRRPTWPSTSIC